MTTYKFLATDSASAMEEVVKKLGPDALIVSTSKRGNKVEIEATDSIPKDATKERLAEKGNFSDILHSKIDVLREKQRHRIYNKSLDQSFQKEGGRNSAKKNDSSDMIRIKDQLNQLQSMLAGMVITEEKNLNEVAANSVPLKLRQFEFSPEVIMSLKPAFEGLSIERGTASFLRAFSKKIACEEVNEVLKSQVTFIVGSSGVGKTTLSAKLAARMMEDKDSSKPSLVSTESHLSSKKDDLSYFARLLNIQKFHYQLEQSVDGFEKLCNGKRIVDLSSIAEESKYFIKDVKDKIGATKVATILCLPTGANKQFIEDQIATYMNLNPIIAFSKADECKLYPRELSVLANKNVKVGFITGSKTILSSLAVTEPEVLASHLESYLIDEVNYE